MAIFNIAGNSMLRCGHIKRWAKRRGVIHHVPPAISPLRYRNHFIILNKTSMLKAECELSLFQLHHFLTKSL